MENQLVLSRALDIKTIRPRVLHQYIEAFRIYRFGEEKDIMLLPKGVFEMVFQSQYGFQHNTNYSEGWKFRPRNFVGGLHTQAYHVVSGKADNYCIVVEFKPNTAKYFIPERLNTYKNAVIDIVDIWGKSAGMLVNKMDKRQSFAEKVELIEAFLCTCFARGADSIIDRALSHIILSKGNIRVQELSKLSFLSMPQFRKRFNEEVGMSPSQYSKVVRVNAALSYVQNSTHNLTDLSYSLGYFDQSHFIRDFKTIVGLSPKKYLAQHAL